MTFDELLAKPIQTDGDFEAYVKALYDEWQGSRKGGAFPTADRLDNYIEGIRRDMPPQFFGGRLDSPVVLLALNPHADGEGGAKELLHEPFCSTWQDYWSYWQNFAHERYADDGRVKQRYAGKQMPSSAYDNKLLSFFASAAGVTKDDGMLAKQGWLGLEFIPLNSPDFAPRQIDGYLRQYVSRIVDVLFLYERKLVIILNGKLGKLLQESGTADFAVSKPEEKSFKVEKTDGTLSAGNCCVGRFELRRNDGRTLRIVAASSFAKQGLNGTPLEDYGRQAFMDEEKQILKELLSR